MSIKVFAPATVANVACGFDVLGLALEQPGDELVVELNETNDFKIFNATQVSLPTNPEKNTTTVAIKALLQQLESNQGFNITFLRKIHPGSGIGSSAASSAAAVFAVNELLGKPFTKKELVAFAMEGERAASGSAHADNVAPALLGGFTLVRSYSPLDVISLPTPENLYCTVVFPDIEVRTKDSRKILRKTVNLSAAVQQWGNVGGLVAGLYSSDYALIGRSLHDVIVEPVRSLLIPEFQKVKQTAIENGALGCSISGSGPSIFALSQNQKIAQKVGTAMQSIFKNINIESKLFISAISKSGAKII